MEGANTHCVHKQVSLAGRRWNIAWRIEDMRFGPQIDVASYVGGLTLQMNFIQFRWANPLWLHVSYALSLTEKWIATWPLTERNVLEKSTLCINWPQKLIMCKKPSRHLLTGGQQHKWFRSKCAYYTQQSVLFCPWRYCLPWAFWKFFFFFSVLDKHNVKHTSNCLRTHCSYNGKSSFTTCADAIVSAFGENLSCWLRGQGAFANCSLHEHVVWHAAFVECTLKCYRFSPGQLVMFALLIVCFASRPWAVKSWNASNLIARASKREGREIDREKIHSSGWTLKNNEHFYKRNSQ